MRVILLKCPILIFFFLFWNAEHVKLGPMGSGKMVPINVYYVQLKEIILGLNDFQKYYKITTPLNACLFKFITHFLLCILDIKANKFCDSSNQLYDAALLNRGFTQHALRLYIDSEINHTRYFIKISCINKRMDFIDMPSIFRDNSVISSIPTYFRNTEIPIICYKYNKICYKYNKPFRSIIFCLI